MFSFKLHFCTPCTFYRCHLSLSIKPLREGFGFKQNFTCLHSPPKAVSYDRVEENICAYLNHTLILVPIVYWVRKTRQPVKIDWVYLRLQSMTSDREQNRFCWERATPRQPTQTQSAASKTGCEIISCRFKSKDVRCSWMSEFVWWIASLSVSKVAERSGK